MAAPPEKIAWRVHPAAERRAMGAIVLGLILALSVLVALWMGGIYWGLFAFAVLFLSLEAFFLPSRFELTPEGVVVRKPFSQVTRPWSHFRRVIFDPLGVTLSPFRRNSWLDSYRAIRLRFTRPGTAGGGPTREQVLSFVTEHVDPECVRIEDDGASREKPRQG